MTEADRKLKAEAKAIAEKDALAKAKSKEGPQVVEVVNGLRVTSGAIPDACVRVKVLVPHDGNGRRAFYRPGEIVDIYHKYFVQQTTPTDENGHKWTVKPAPFELLK